MAVRLPKLAVFSASMYSIFALIAKSKNQCATIFASNKAMSNVCAHHQFSTDQAIPEHLADALKSKDGANADHDFWRCSNGGGMFHKIVCVHPTAVIDIGAIVHSQSLVGENVYIGSRAIVGPAMIIGKLARLGYSRLPTSDVIAIRIE